MTDNPPTDKRQALDEAGRRWLSTYLLFNQADVWLPKDRPAVQVADMDPEWRLNTARFLERHAGGYADSYGWGEVMFPGGMPDDVADAVFAAQAERGRDPLAWIRSTKLYRALVADLPTDKPGLAALADRARHWSTCPARSGSACACDAGPRADDEALAGIATVVREIREAAARAEAERLERERRAEGQRRLQEWMAANPGIDPDTGRPYGVDPDGLDHNQRHGDNEWCRFDSCGNCGGYHCGWFCPDLHGEVY